MFPNKSFPWLQKPWPDNPIYNYIISATSISLCSF